MNDLAVKTDFCDNAGAETMASQQAVSEKDGPLHIIERNEEFAPIDLDLVEQYLMSQEQAECPVHHYFGPGVCIRELFVPAGSLVLSHKHKEQTMNILLKGKAAVVINDEVRVIEGPYIFVSEPGRKLGYAIEDVVWQNVLATDETDPERIEDMFVEKTDAWKIKQEEKKNADAISDAVRKNLGGLVLCQ
jgi:hypothetical protein